MTNKQALRKLRKDIGYNAEKLAELVGCSPSMIHQYERGDYEVPRSRYEDMASALGVSIDVIDFTMLGNATYTGSDRALRKIKQSEINDLKKRSVEELVKEVADLKNKVEHLDKERLSLLVDKSELDYAIMEYNSKSFLYRLFNKVRVSKDD